MCFGARQLLVYAIVQHLHAITGWTSFERARFARGREVLLTPATADLSTAPVRRTTEGCRISPPPITSQSLSTSLLAVLFRLFGLGELAVVAVDITAWRSQELVADMVDAGDFERQLSVSTGEYCLCEERTVAIVATRRRR